MMPISPEFLAVTHAVRYEIDCGNSPPTTGYHGLVGDACSVMAQELDSESDSIETEYALVASKGHSFVAASNSPVAMPSRRVWEENLEQLCERMEPGTLFNNHHRSLQQCRSECNYSLEAT